MGDGFESSGRELNPAREDRVDPKTRSRLDEIVAGLDAWRERVDTRYRRVIWFVSLGGVIFAIAFGWLVVKTRVDSNTSRQALCALRHDLEIRVQQSRAFLRQHPTGIAGIPVAAIQQSIDNSQRTITALSSVDCSDV